MAELTIVVPAYNEEESLRKLLPQWIGFCQENGLELIIVNDGSTDGTAELLAAHEGAPCLTTCTHKVNRGYGGAIKSGLENTGTRYAITIDADGQHQLDDILALYQAIRRTGADMIIGKRSGSAGVGLYRRIGKRLIRWFARLLMAIEIEDLNSGIRIFEVDKARRYSRLCPDHMAFSDVITLVFISKKCLVLEEPVTVKPRIAGNSTINTLTALETVEAILNIVVLFNPMRVFLPISVGAVVLALAWGIPIVLQGRGVSTGALLSFMVGILFFCLGLLAEQLSQIRLNSVED